LRLPPLRRQQYRLALIRYLQFCKQTHQQATVESARQFMETVHAKRLLGVSLLATWKEALNWFFKEGQKQSSRTGVRPVSAPADPRHGHDAHATAEVITDVPTLGAADLGTTEWEQLLIRELRTRHYQWRTEQTYRGWAGRFAQWLASRGATVGEATNAQIHDFLSDLATRQRVSASTQKQALNALVFLLLPLVSVIPSLSRDLLPVAA
jgi:hypothetical protein